MPAENLDILRLVFSGGGAKGVVYPGAFHAMVDTGAFQSVTEVAGSSVGSITAAMIAAGIRPEALRQFVSINFAKLMGRRVGRIFKKNPAGMMFITRDGEELLDFIRKGLTNTIRSYIESIADIELFRRKHPEAAVVFDKFASNALPIITFRDLDILSTFNPQRFKKLIITAATFPECELQILNAELTPDVEVALACRASCSIPGILQPVDIQIGSTVKRFVDGGIFDNMPTDYFEEECALLRSSIDPMRYSYSDLPRNLTSVDSVILFEGENPLVDNKLIYIDHIKKTMHEVVVSDDTRADFDALKLKCSIPYALATKEERELVKRVTGRTHLFVKNQKIDQTLVFALSEGSLKHESAIFHALHGSRPSPYKTGRKEKFERDVLVRRLGNITPEYSLVERKEDGYKKISKEYALRTVELRVSPIGMRDFSKATRLARIMSAFGYLDTVAHIINYELHDETSATNFKPDDFYKNIVENFDKIYSAVLLGAGKNPCKDNLLTKLHADNVSLRERYRLIREHAGKEVYSPIAFALSRTVEFVNHQITAETLFKETYERSFEYSGFFSVSKIAGECVFQASTLRQKLKNQHMFGLFKEQQQHPHHTRSKTVFDALNQIERFNIEYKRFNRGPHVPEESAVIVSSTP